VWQEHGEHLERELSVANERIKRLEEMYEGEIGENEQFLGSNLQGLLTRELNWSKDRIKRLEEELNELRSDESRLLNSNGELERRIKRILEAGDKMFPWSERVGQEFWTKAKEAKL
jgi:chromosome segregation ATPase